MQVTTIGLDLAKNIFQVHGVSESGEIAFNKPLRRAQLLRFFSKLPPCLVGMEACGSSHYWAHYARRGSKTALNCCSGSSRRLPFRARRLAVY